MGNKPGVQPGLVFSCRCASFRKADTSPEAVPQACALPCPLLTMELQTSTYGVLSTLLSHTRNSSHPLNQHQFLSGNLCKFKEYHLPSEQRFESSEPLLHLESSKGPQACQFQITKKCQDSNLPLMHPIFMVMPRGL